MDILELARTLGQAIRDDERVARYNKAREEFESDRQLQDDISEYKTQKAALDEESRKSDPDSEFVKTIEKRIAQLYKDITTKPVMVEYSDAEADVNELMNRVNRLITAEITGEDEEEGCSGSCSSCSGCH